MLDGRRVDGEQARSVLNQGPFTIDQDEGWRTIAAASPGRDYVRNVGCGMVGYTWEENGPSLAVRAGERSLEEQVERTAALACTDVLYIRCDWRDVQQRPGRLGLHPVWELTLDAAKRRGLRVAFRVQLSSPNGQPDRLALPDFVADRVPLVDIGRIRNAPYGMLEPRYDHPAFQQAFRELNELLADRFDGDPLVEFADLMMYGFWGEGHSGPLPHPFPDDRTAEETCLAMTEMQLAAWRRTPLAVNTQPDISQVGNNAVRELALAHGCWLRSDSILIEEPEQIGLLAGHPSGAAVIMEDGYDRHYNETIIPSDQYGLSRLENAMLHALDVGANYWSLWTESDQVERFMRAHPDALGRLRDRLGYRLRPAWIWQRKRMGTDEVVVAVKNDGVSGVPGTLWLKLTSPDGKLNLSGVLDIGHPYGGQLRLASFLLPAGYAGQELLLGAELETRPDVRHPVAWSCAQPLRPNSLFPLRLAEHDEEGWRYGV